MVKLPVEVLKRFEGPKVGGFGSSFQMALMPDIQFILEGQYKELLMAKPVGRGILKVFSRHRMKSSVDCREVASV